MLNRLLIKVTLALFLFTGFAEASQDKSFVAYPFKKQEEFKKRLVLSISATGIIFIGICYTVALHHLNNLPQPCLPEDDPLPVDDAVILREAPPTLQDLCRVNWPAFDHLLHQAPGIDKNSYISGYLGPYEGRHSPCSTQGRMLMLHDHKPAATADVYWMLGFHEIDKNPRLDPLVIETTKDLGKDILKYFDRCELPRTSWFKKRCYVAYRNPKQVPWNLALKFIHDHCRKEDDEQRKDRIAHSALVLANTVSEYFGVTGEEGDTFLSMAKLAVLGEAYLENMITGNEILLRKVLNFLAEYMIANEDTGPRYSLAALQEAMKDKAPDLSETFEAKHIFLYLAHYRQ